MVRFKVIFFFAILALPFLSWGNDILQMRGKRFVVHRSSQYPFVEGDSYNIIDQNFKTIGRARIIKNTDKFSLAILESGHASIGNRLFPMSIGFKGERGLDEEEGVLGKLTATVGKKEKEKPSKPWRVYTRISQYMLSELNLGIEYPLGEHFALGLQGFYLTGSIGEYSFDGKVYAGSLSYYFSKIYSDSFYFKLGMGQLGVTTLSTYQVDGGGEANVEQVSNGNFMVGSLGYLWQWSRLNVGISVGLRKYNVTTDTTIDMNVDVDLSNAPFQSTEALADINLGILL